MTQSIIWVHEDAMGKPHPLYTGIKIETDAFYVWDEDHLREMDYGFQRLVFIYETLCELGVTIYHGNIEKVAVELARLRSAEHIRTAFSPNPVIQAVTKELAQTVSVVTIGDEPFVTLKRPIKLKRFFSYWKKARPVLLRE